MLVAGWMTVSNAPCGLFSPRECIHDRAEQVRRAMLEKHRMTNIAVDLIREARGEEWRTSSMRPPLPTNGMLLRDYDRLE